MTDKQIICHGVDVSKCDRLNLNSAYGWDDPDMCSIPCCRNAPNCLFKQLARKTQECESWKKANDEKNKFLQDLGISASGEFKRIKFYIENLKNKYEEKIEELRKICLGSGMDFYLQKIETLEEKLNAQFAEMEEKLTAEENKNFELKENIKTIFTSLIIANHVDIGAIQNTIWVDKYITLWDYIRIILNMDDKQFEEFEKQAIKQMEEVK